MVTGSIPVEAIGQKYREKGENEMENVFDVEITTGQKDGKATFRIMFARELLTIDKELQAITTCGIRQEGKVRTYWGNTISNPNDRIDKGRGRQIAFRRAYISMAIQLFGSNSVNVAKDYIWPNTKVKEIYNFMRRKLFELKAWNE